MGRGLMMGAAFALAACSTGSGAARSFEDPAVQQLFNMPTPRYFATLKVANQVAQNCARYRYDAILDAELNERRNEVGRGTLTARPLTAQIEAETDVTQRSFQGKHGVELTGADLCPAADAEVLENSALSALLVPV
ncbi:hypothetical protein [Cognatiyoonia sp. IB215182]|uniref:hypothetical protein n=1 Tax=Cognatiyoonia sp. IB215182 TaxID=3097353 RepID=UPI002A0EBE3F|nr:hypothetical protein [Cognatiyoonia sp. IB215182]MDX8352329.1 hypothetical protein [Cognatiyoonia sp. IB215182]